MTGRPAAAQPVPADLLIRDVRVLHGDGRVTPRASVVVRAGIVDLVQPLRAPVPPGGDVPATRVIEGDGLTLIPGLIDAHVHVQPWTLPLFLQYGVTTVRDLHNDGTYVFPLAAGSALDRPRIVPSGPIFDGAGGDRTIAIVVASVGEARTAVRRQIEAGARVIKVSPGVDPVLLSVLASEARARGVPVAAHLGRTTATQAGDVGVTSIEHLSGVAESASPDGARLVKAHADFFGGWTEAMLEWRHLSIQRLETVARELVARGVAIVPTLVAHEAVSRLADPGIDRDSSLAEVPREVMHTAWVAGDVMARAKWTPAVLAQFRQALPILQQFVGIYAREGGRVVAGSDVGQAFVVPGAGLHRELQLIVASGLSPAQALKAATVDAAALLGIQDRVGTIDPGMAADLVLLAADPLTDIRNTTRIVAVVKDGVVLPSAPRMRP